MPSTTELLHEADWRRYASDEVAFFHEVWKIKHPEHGAIPFDVRDTQRNMLQLMRDEKQLICLKARQIGWSTIVASHCFWVAYFQDSRDILFISRTEDEATKLLSFVTFGYDHLPEWLKRRGPKRLDNNLTKITFGNYSSIESRPSKQDPARGRTAYITVVDEWAFLGEGRTEDQEKAWASLKPTADIGGRIIGLSTANGAGNFFHDFWNKAESGHSNFRPVFLPWWSVPGRDQKWYEDQKKDMLPWQVAQEYPSNPEEAFIKSGNPVFDVDLLRALPTEEPRYGYLHREAPRKYLFRDEGGPLAVWELPQPDEKYVLGADVAQGLEHGDYSVAYVFSVRLARVVACWYGHIEPDLFGEELEKVGYFYNKALLGIEANNHGLTTATILRRARYPRIYYRRTFREGRTSEPLKEIGWLTTIATKPLMVDELARVIRTHEVDITDGAFIKEALTFVRDEKGQMAGSPFDDRVMAMCIANQMRKHAHFALDPEEENDEWTLNWWSRQADEANEPEPWVIGSHSVRKSGW